LSSSIDWYAQNLDSIYNLIQLTLFLLPEDVWVQEMPWKDFYLGMTQKYNTVLISW
jgi:hypothetical protein